MSKPKVPVEPNKTSTTSDGSGRQGDEPALQVPDPAQVLAVLRQLDANTTELRKRTFSLASAHAGLASGGALTTPIRVQGEARGEATPVEAAQAFHEVLARARRGYEVANRQPTTPESRALEQSVLIAAQTALDDAEALETRIAVGMSGSGVDLQGVTALSTQKQRNAQGGRFAAIDNQAVSACQVNDPGEICAVDPNESRTLQDQVRTRLGAVGGAWKDAIKGAALAKRLEKNFVADLVFGVFLAGVGGLGGLIAAKVLSKAAQALKGAGSDEVLALATLASPEVVKGAQQGLGAMRGGGSAGSMLEGLGDAVDAWQVGLADELQYMDDHQLMMLRERLQPFMNPAYWRAELSKLVARYSSEVESIHAQSDFVSGSEVGVVWVRAEDGRRRLAQVRWEQSVSDVLVHLKFNSGERFVDWISTDMEAAAIARHQGLHGKVEEVAASEVSASRVKAWASAATGK